MIEQDTLHHGPVLPSRIVTLPSFMAKHHHSYMQLVIGLTGRCEFNVNGEVNLVGPGQGCVVYSHQNHSFGGIGQAEILVLNFSDFTQKHSQAVQLLKRALSGEVYFQVDFQMQQLLRLLVSEVKNNPNDQLLLQACQDTVLATLHQHIETYVLLKKGNRLNMAQIDRYIDQH
ncbi:MAG: AraC family ligand binding domain-containing protein, partial [Vibrio sp.]